MDIGRIIFKSSYICIPWIGKIISRILSFTIPLITFIIGSSFVETIDGIYDDQEKMKLLNTKKGFEELLNIILIKIKMKKEKVIKK